MADALDLADVLADARGDAATLRRAGNGGQAEYVEDPREGATKGKHSAPDQGAAIPSASPSPVRLPGDAAGEHAAERQKCPRCHGRTYEILMFDNLRMPCHVCGATGWVPVPAGSDAGERGA